MGPIKFAIFDLGNVLYNFSFDNAFHYWSEKSGKSFLEIKKLYREDDMYLQHEVNKISIGQYKEHVCEMLGIDLSLHDFIVGWNSIFMDEIEGVSAMLEEAKKSMTLLALSNTNEIHCAYMHRKYWNLFRLFDKMYFSHEIQSRKPDQASFSTVLADFQLNANEVLFLDDRLENVHCAESLGIKSIHVKCAGDIHEGIRRYCKQ